MVSWNETLSIFNDSVISGSIATREFQRKRLVARSSEARRQFSVRRYWTINCGGLMVNDAQLEEIRNFEAATRQGIDPCLVRIASFDHLENADGSASFLGTGNGTEQTFQLKKRSSYQGAVFEETISYPWFNYPNLKDLNGEDWEPLKPLQIWLGAPTLVHPDMKGVYTGTEVTNDCEINRNSGQVTSDLFGQLYATGGFLTRMTCPTGFGVKVEGCVFIINDGVQFVEPFPEGGEILG